MTLFNTQDETIRAAHERVTELLFSGPRIVLQIEQRHSSRLSGGSGCVHLPRLRQRWSGISARCSQETNLSMRRLRR